MRKIIGIYVLLTLLACCAAAFAQQDETATDKQQRFRLFEVVEVTVNANMLESATTIAEVTAEQIQQRTVTNIGEALEMLPGVHFRMARSKNEQQVTVRGFEQEKVLILMDGIPVSNPYEGQINLADFPVQNIAAIKLIKGVSSTLYGANGMGGVINITTKRGTEKPSLSAEYEGSQYATHNIQIGHGWKKGPFSYYAAFGHRESNGYPLAGTWALPKGILDSMASSPANPTSIPNIPIPDDEGSRDNSDYVRNAFTFTGDVALGTKNTLGVSFERYDNKYGASPVPLYREHRSQNGRLVYFPRYWRWTDWNRTMVNVIDESRITENLTIKTRGFYDMYDNTLDIYDGPDFKTQNRTSPPSGSSLYDDYDAGFNVYGYWRGIPGSELRAALNFRRDVHRSTSATPPPVQPTDSMSSDTISIGVEDEFSVGKLSMTPGFGVDFFNKRQLHQKETDLEPGEDISSFSPQIGVRYEASDKVSIYGSVGRKIRFPTMRNLYADGVIGPIGDPDLKEESALNVETGVDLAVNDNINIGGSFFYSRVNNMIGIDNLVGRFEQYPKASIAGFELTAGGNITDFTQARLSYTYMRSRVLGDVTIKNEYIPALTYRPVELPYRPAHQFDVEVGHKFRFGLDAAFNGMYVSESVYYNREDPATNKRMAAIRESLDGYFLANVKFTQKLAGGFSLTFAVKNLLNQQYEALYLYPAAGRSYHGGIKFSM